MSYSIILAILFSTIALSSSSLNAFPNNERNVLVRFYSTFAQLYRPATSKSYTNEEQTMESYRFIFSEKEYLQIPEESFTMFHTNVIERMITYHPMPNFEVNGTRYFYRRDMKQMEAMEIELVNPATHLFREVQQPNRYFYLTSFDNLQYSEVPLMPYYEVTFICNSSFPTDRQTQPPLLSYMDKSFFYTPRYSLDVPSFGINKQAEMYAYADISNYGEQTMVIKGAELIAGDVHLNPTTDLSFTRLFGEQSSGTYVYQLPISSSLTISPHSTKSLRFFQTNVTIEPFVSYSSVFLPINSKGKLIIAYNLTSFNQFLPHGRLLLREQGRFIGQINLPDLTMNETFTMIFGYDAEVSYHRQVQLLQGDENSDTMVYEVEYTFENSKSSTDVRAYFLESFSTLKYFQIQNISTSNDMNDVPDLVSYGTDLRGYMYIPRQGGQKIISYNLIISKYPLTANVSQEIE